MDDRKQSKRTTIYDVAQAAGVSYQTVSRVVNGSPNVADHTRQRVLQAMADLGYRPNRAARALKTQRSQIIEVITVSLWASGLFAINAMAETARRHGYQLTVMPVNAENFREVLAGAQARLLDGIVLTTERMDIDDDELLRLTRGIPFVRMIGAASSRIPAVSYDQEHGARLATQHLIDRGHTRIAAISGPFEMHDARARHAAWLATLEANSLEPGPFVQGSFTHESGCAGINHLLDGGEDFSAVFCANDNMAFGAMVALHKRGLRVPDDISLVGFDDRVNAAYVIPPLTTVRQDMSLLGKLAVEHLIAYIEQPEAPVQQRVLTPALIVRSSTRAI